jgi:hypothetical protein
MRTSKLIAIAGLVLFGLSGPASDANAATVLWTVQSATFNDGGTLSGSFDFDATTTTYSNVALTTTTGQVLTGDSYSSCQFGNTCPGAFIGFGVIRLLNLVFAAALTDAGGTVGFGLGPTGTTEENEAFSFPPTVLASRNLISGGVTGVPDVSAVPLPATLPLFATGLGALGLLGWRRKRKA